MELTERDGEYVDVDLTGARFRNVSFRGAVLREADLLGARLSGRIDGLIVNDVEVGPLIAAELDRRHPERLQLRPTDADGARAAWAVIDGLWGPTMARAASVPEAEVHERIDGEWSFVETLRHLVFVTDIWFGRPILGGQLHPWGVAPTFIPDPAALGLDMSAAPSLAEVASVRRERMHMVAAALGDLDDAGVRRPVAGPGGETTVLGCLLVVLDEEWHHHWFATRDLVPPRGSVVGRPVAGRWI